MLTDCTISDNRAAGDGGGIIGSRGHARQLHHQRQLRQATAEAA